MWSTVSLEVVKFSFQLPSRDGFRVESVEFDRAERAVRLELDMLI